jgi:hypothetical protein
VAKHTFPMTARRFGTAGILAVGDKLVLLI